MVVRERLAVFSSWPGHFSSMRNVCKSRVSKELEGEMKSAKFNHIGGR